MTLPHERPIVEAEEMLKNLKKNALWSPDEFFQMEEKIVELKNKVYQNLTAAERIAICRHPKRPHALDYIKHLSDESMEIYGDRAFQDDHAVVTALCLIQGQKYVVIGQEKGSDTESRIYRNFGMMHPEGYRKALRAMELAAKFSLPVLTLIDTPGAYPGLTAEERGQGWAIAKNLWAMARLPTPIIVVLIGEGCSGGALGIGIGDVIGMMEHSYYSVISPEGCASILWKDATKSPLAAEALKMHVEDLLELGIVDEKIEEPLGGAHLNPEAAYAKVKQFIQKSWDLLKSMPVEIIVERRYQKFRKMGRIESNETTFTSSPSQ
jgi:acetyl-CoA carboxylase carboxyl transferase subunit alpha